MPIVVRRELGSRWRWWTAAAGSAAAWLCALAAPAPTAADAPAGVGSAYPACDADGERPSSIGILAATLDAPALTFEPLATLVGDRVGAAVLFVDAERALAAYGAPGGFWDVAFGEEPRWIAAPPRAPELSQQHAVTNVSDLVQAFYAADLDGDGDQDVVTLFDGPLLRVWERHGHGLVFRSELTVVANDGAPPLAIADMDADGLLDIVTVEVDRPTVHFGDDELRFDRITTGPALQPRNHAVMDVHAYDADGDGAPDVVALLDAYSFGGDHSVVAHFAGEGASGLRTGVTSVVGPTFLTSPAFGDVTADGLVDLVFTRAVPAVDRHTVHVARGREDGTFEAGATVFELRAANARLRLLDADGDGRNEIVIGHAQGLTQLRLVDAARLRFEPLTRAMPIDGLRALSITAATETAPARAHAFVQRDCAEPCGEDCLGSCLLDTCFECVSDTDCGGGRCRDARCVACDTAAECDDVSQCVDHRCTRVVGETRATSDVDVRWRGGGCALARDGSVSCFGGSSWGDLPQGKLVAIAVADAVASDVGLGCAIRADGTLACWAGDGQAIAAPPSGRFTSCWSLTGAQPPAPPPGSYREIAVGEEHACGLLEDRTLRCWGCTTPPSNDVPASPSDAGDNGCWLNYGQAFPPAGRYSALAIDSLSGCALEHGSGALKCWGNGFAAKPGFIGATTVASGPFVELVAGRNTACARKASGRVECFGVWAWTPRSTDFVALAGHGGEFCGVRKDGRLECSTLTPP